MTNHNKKNYRTFKEVFLKTTIREIIMKFPQYMFITLVIIILFNNNNKIPFYDLKYTYFILFFSIIFLKIIYNYIFKNDLKTNVYIEKKSIKINNYIEKNIIIKKNMFIAIIVLLFLLKVFSYVFVTCGLFIYSIICNIIIYILYVLIIFRVINQLHLILRHKKNDS
jgi:hypothetical protein